jgi:chitin synthase
MEDFRKTAVRALAPFKPPPETHRPSEDDSNRTFRTRLILFWMLSNAAMVFAIQNIAGLDPDEKLFRHRQSMYFNVVLIGVFFLTLYVRTCRFSLCSFWCSRRVKFLGALYFWIFHELLAFRWLRRN